MKSGFSYNVRDTLLFLLVSYLTFPSRASVFTWTDMLRQLYVLPH